MSEKEEWKSVFNSDKNEQQNNGTYHEGNSLNDLTGKEWLPLTKSFWMQTGLGANHEHAQIEKQHPAPYGFKDISKLILFFTKKGDVVLDPFSGVASTSKACALTGRKSVGIELTKKWVDLSKERLKKEVPNSKGQEIINGDSRIELKNFKDEYFDFMVTSPPYWQILNKKLDHKTKERVKNGLSKKYSENKDDLGNIIDYPEFLSELKNIFSECYRVLKNKKYTAVVVSDFRHKSDFIPYHIDVIKLMQELNFELKGITILAQNHKSLKPYGYPYAYVQNIHHQYILIFRKNDKRK
ncbi:DNA methylase [Candidatus Woesearchaeota archaeon CG_4_10_14_0_2_um_filter_33_10]|nr:MAG: hypothetical protein AUJ83_04280 [Candidatus Woesearchaeota archaeon CG1_02_33_12]PIU72133.1 MAG: DNA methylase [Candidatus Woesearchaeota archaeon CG06_land_8_20_14_3_00_33_13]PIZ52863.1 MAG: DNA methylase [Candidatus Woesearchaeota archaeon CG_4_10_14_0_2_um_filter_33_10]